jgi:hypothetical protein
MKVKIGIWILALAWSAVCSLAVAEEPDQVRPSTGTVQELRDSATAQANTFGEYLDQGHDWLYRRLQYLIEDVDTWSASPGSVPVAVPISTLRIDFDSDILHKRNGLGLSSASSFEASLSVPNLEQRLRLLITSDSLQEAPGDPANQQNPLRAVLRYVPSSDVDFEAGIQAKVWPTAFGAVRWAHILSAGSVRVYPFAKLYAITGTGLGVSGGLAVERWSDLWVMRSASYANWVHNTAATSWSQTFILGYAHAVIQERSYDRFADGRDLGCGMAGQLLISGDRISRTSLYETSVVFKRPLRGGWLFGYAGPLVRWDRANSWHADAGIRIGFNALFWGPATGATPARSYCG